MQYVVVVFALIFTFFFTCVAKLDFLVDDFSFVVVIFFPLLVYIKEVIQLRLCL